MVHGVGWVGALAGCSVWPVLAGWLVRNRVKPPHAPSVAPLAEASNPAHPNLDGCRWIAVGLGEGHIESPNFLVAREQAAHLPPRLAARDGSQRVRIGPAMPFFQLLRPLNDVLHTSQNRVSRVGWNFFSDFSLFLLRRLKKAVLVLRRGVSRGVVAEHEPLAAPCCLARSHWKAAQPCSGGFGPLTMPISPPPRRRFAAPMPMGHNAPFIGSTPKLPVGYRKPSGDPVLMLPEPLLLHAGPAVRFVQFCAQARATGLRGIRPPCWP